MGGYDPNGSKDDLYVYDITTNTWISEKMLIARKNATVHIQDNRLYCIGGEKSSSSYISNTHVYELANIQQSFQEVIIPITEDNSFDTFAHVTEINSLDSTSPILKADFLVEI